LQKRKLFVNTTSCDARFITEAVLEQYESVTINAAVIAVSAEAAELMAKYQVNMNAADIIKLPKEAEILFIAGYYELNAGTVFTKPVVLIVNGSLKISPDVSQQAFENIIKITVNGDVECPADLKILPPLIVNGTMEVYPGDAIKLKDNFVVDKSFAIRAKGKKYYAKRSIAMLDSSLDIAALAERGVTFTTKKAFIAEDIFEAAVPLFAENVDLIMIPSGYAYVKSCVLNDKLLSKYGNKLFIDGDLTVNSESESTLESLSGAIIEGTVITAKKYKDIILKKDIEFKELWPVNGTFIKDRGILHLDKRTVEKSEEGITVLNCGVVYLAGDITPDEIEAKLEFIGCGAVCCQAEQRGAVELVSQNIGVITDSGKDKLKEEPPDAKPLADDEQNVVKISAASYRF
jgi:hypothetical protein